MNPFDINLIWFSPLVNLLMDGLRLFATPLQGIFSAGVAGGLAIVLFTLAIRLLLLPLSLQQVRSQKAQMAIQPDMKALQKRYKGDRDGMARAQMALYREKGVNPAAGCLPLLIQMPILFGMYSALSQLSTQGLTLDQVQANSVQAGQVVYAASRTQAPQPINQFTLFSFQVTPNTTGPVDLTLVQDQSALAHNGTDLLSGTQSLTLTPGQSHGGVNPPNTPTGQATLFLRPGGARQSDGSLNRNATFTVGEPYVVEVEVNASQTRVDTARAQVVFNPDQVDVANVQTPAIANLPFHSDFLWLPSLGEPDVIAHLGSIGIPGILLILMTISSFLSQRMSTIPSDDPQQQAMMRSMAFMPLMYLIFFLQTPAGLVVYWLVSNFFQMAQQYFTTGLGTLADDLRRFSGRDFQPPWAHVRLQPALAGTGAGTASTYADRESDVGDGYDTTPAAGSRSSAAASTSNGIARRARAGSGKGRKRGKR